VQCTRYLLLIRLLVQKTVMATAVNIDSNMLKQLSRMYEAGISIQDISEQMCIDVNTVKTLLRLLGYRSSD
jgi:DNA-binding NarL/FixJ family response regulator